MKKQILIGVAFLIVLGCSKKECGCHTPPEVSNVIALSVVDTLGQDLLDTMRVNTLDIKSIETFYLKSGRMYDDFPPVFQIYEDSDKTFVLELGLYYNPKEDTSITVIKWHNQDYDTIRGFFEYLENPDKISLRKAWFNEDELVQASRNIITKKY